MTQFGWAIWGVVVVNAVFSFWQEFRTERPNLVFAGTAVASGTGRAVVFATGMATAFGTIAQLTQSVAEELSPLQKEVNRLTKVVTFLAITIGVVFFAISVGLAGRPLAVGFIFAVGMVVALAGILYGPVNLLEKMGSTVSWGSGMAFLIG